MSSIGFDIFAVDRASAVFDRVGASADRMGKATHASGTNIAKGFGTAALAVGVLGFASVKMAADFQTLIVRLETTAGESHKNLGMVSAGILNMAGRVGYTANELAKGMYTVESAGFHGAQGLAVLEASAKGARIEGADLSTVTNAVTSALVDYHLKGTDAAYVTNVLVAATGRGKTTFEGMAAALPNVAAAAASAHIPLVEVASAIATMTMHGTDAAKAGTYLRQVIGQLEAPTAKARKTMQALGLDANQVGLDLGHKGLAYTIGEVDNAITKHLTPSGLVAMQTFEKSTGKTSDYQKMLANLPPTMITTFGALSTMVGGVKSLQGFLQLGGANLSVFRANTAAVAAQVRAGGKDVAGYALQQKTFNGQLQDAKGAASALMVQIGTGLMPYMQKFVVVIMDAVGWMSQHSKATTVAVGAAMALVAAWGAAIVVVKAYALWTGLSTIATRLSMSTLGTFVGVKYLEIVAWVRSTAGTVAHTVALVASRVAMGAVRLATLAWTGAQWLLNAALDANPIGIVIVAVAALAAGFIFAYTHSARFRDIINASWRGIVSVTQWAWNNVLRPVFSLWAQQWQMIGRVATWLWSNVLAPTFRFIVNAWLTVAGAIVHGANYAFGWIPFLHDKLANAVRAFDGFRNGVNAAINGITPSRTVRVNASFDVVNVGGNVTASTSATNKYAAMARAGYALGGPVHGSGRGDTVPAMLEPGEFVVRRDGSNLMDAHAHYAKGYAAGGVVAHGSLPQASAVLHASMAGTFQMIANGVKALGHAFGGTTQAYRGGAGAGQWAGLVLQVLAMLHQSPGLLGGVLRRINMESGGNPNAINLWDINAQQGHPSQGLMQTIPSTFYAYAGPFARLGITNPLASIYAGLRYALSRYGSISAIDPLVRPYGYDRGGLLMPGLHMVYNGTGKPETIVPPGAGSAGGTIHLHFEIDGREVGHVILKDGRVIQQSLLKLKRSQGGHALGLA